MNEFEKIVFRLKAALELRFDKDVATHLGMTKKAFFERKKRDVFPTMNLWALSAMHPELKLDVPYILTGVASPELAEPKKTGIKTNPAKALVMTPISLTHSHPRIVTHE